jgi:hypothetical protein
VVGMGAVFAGIVRAPMTSVLIIFEMKGGYRRSIRLLQRHRIGLSRLNIQRNRDTAKRHHAQQRGITFRHPCFRYGRHLRHHLHRGQRCQPQRHAELHAYS